jgi:hypothetical protein
MFTWVSKLADTFFTKFLEDHSHIEYYCTTYHRRLRDSYYKTIQILEEYSIPFKRANAGVFIWVDLSSWLVKFDDGCEDAIMGKEMKLTIWLLEQGVYLEPGQVSFL